MRESLDWRKYILALLVTVAIFGTVVYGSTYLESRRIAELRSIQDQISIDTLSLDTQFSLLETAPCDNEDKGTELTTELNDLGTRLAATEGRLGTDDPQVVQLKQQYTLLEIRDYIITKQLSNACSRKPPATVLYFYSNAGDCPDCDKAGYALSYMHETYPDLKVYSFDYNLDLGALKTLIALDHVKPSLPAFIIGGKPSYGFTTLEELKAQFPAGALATSTATSTASTTKGIR